MTAEDLRNRMFESLQKKGFVDSLKSHLRNRLVVELKNVGQSVHLGLQLGLQPNQQQDTLILRTINSLIVNHLRQSSYDYTLSVFLPECAMTPATLFTTEDVLKLLHISPQSKLYRSLTEPNNVHQKGFMWRFLNELAACHGHPTTESGTQTELSRFPFTSSLEEEFRMVDSYYSEIQDNQISRVHAIEERILSYQRQLEERSRSTLQMEMARFKDNQLAMMRVEEREKSRKDIENARKEFERTYRTKHDALEERERNGIERIHQQEQAMERETYAQRQLILEEIEALRQKELQVKRQDELYNRESKHFEDMVKHRQNLLKHQEENISQRESQFEEHLQQELVLLKREEHSHYIDRLGAVEERERKVKEIQRQFAEKVEQVSTLKAELQRETETIRHLEFALSETKHNMADLERDHNIVSEQNKQLIDYDILKMDNAALKREMDILKLQISELTQDNANKTQKLNVLIEMGLQGSRSGDVVVLQKQIAQLENTLRTERTLTEHDKFQIQLQNDVNLPRYQTSWRQTRYQANPTQSGLLSADLASCCDSFCDVVDSKSRTGIDADLMFDSLCSVNEGLSTAIHSEDYSCSSDIVADTKNRLRRLETEAEKLEKHYQNFNFRVTNLDPVLEPNSVYLSQSKVTFSSDMNLRKAPHCNRDEGELQHRSNTEKLILRPRPNNSMERELMSGRDETERKSGDRRQEHLDMKDMEQQQKSAECEKPYKRDASRPEQGWRDMEMAEQNRKDTEKVEQSKRDMEKAEQSRRHMEKAERNRRDLEKIELQRPAMEQSEEGKRDGRRREDDDVDLAVGDTKHGNTYKMFSDERETLITNRDESSMMKDLEEEKLEDNENQLLQIEEQRMLEHQEKHQRKIEEQRLAKELEFQEEHRKKIEEQRHAEEMEYQEEHRRKMEERKLAEEEAWRKEQECLAELEARDKKQSKSESSESDVTSSKSNRTDHDVSSKKDVKVEVVVDPVMQKYMDMVQEQKLKEKQTVDTVVAAEEKQEDLSITDSSMIGKNSESTTEYNDDDKDEFWN